MGIVVTGVIVVVGAGLVAVALAMVVHGRLRTDTVTDFRDHSSLVSGVAGTLFAITVGMLVVASWGAIGTARDNAAAEARSLDDLAWFAHTTRQPYENRLTALLETYTQQVIGDDWPDMSKHNVLAQDAWNTLDAIRYEFSTYTPHSSVELTRYQQALGQLQTVYDDRLVRQDEAHSTVPSILWLALVVSGSVVVIVPVVFGSTKRNVHCLLSFATAGVMAFVLFMISEFTHPFAGAIRVNADAFVTTDKHIQQIDTLWAGAQEQQAKARFRPAPMPSSMISLLATPSTEAHPRKEHKRSFSQNAVPVPGLPAPGVPAPVVEPGSPTEAAPPPQQPPRPQPSQADAGSGVAPAPPQQQAGTNPQSAPSP